ncbi:hypothetical protein MSAN_00076400 [Mycena sanguinolenta]|uniref:Vacuolar sorting protein Vps3844 C-terminal domain-containing protein n=1 Tax=Mycena sanguinolenta TaxID=230812 RepID=A0A8H6ZCT7_9AGAR|nr:hypothetical protein MSAN_00076400 [Mycena sanguinolenta]
MWSTFAVVLCGLQAAQAVNVYLYPPQTFLSPNLAVEDASAALSRHLGLEIFEAFRDSSALDYSEESFVGQGSNNVLLLTVEDVDAEAIRIPSLQPSFKLPTPPLTSISSLSSVISTYLHRARHAYTSIHSADPTSQIKKAWYIAELDSIMAFFDKAQGASFAAAELSGLANIRNAHGADSEEYRSVLDGTRKLLEHAIDHDVRVAMLSFSPSAPAAAKRAEPSQAPFPRPPPQSPIGSISTCHTTLDVCNNATSSCSGRGECVSATKAGRTCFVCSCETTSTGTGNQVKTETWVGESCERKDVSGPFVLLAGTTIVLILIAFGSVSLLYTVGTIELPGVLMGGAVNPKKD